MRRIAALGALTAVALLCAPALATAATPTYYTLPSGYTVSNTGMTQDESGDVWFSAAGPSHVSSASPQQPTPTLGRIDPAAVTPGASTGLAFFPTPDPQQSPLSCCANQLRSVTYNKKDHKLYYVRSDGGYGYLDPTAVQPGQGTNIFGFATSSYTDLWDVAPAKDGGAWLTEYSTTNQNTGTQQAPYYAGARIAYANGGSLTEGPNIAMQNNQTALNSLRYDARPSGITVTSDGAPWFVEGDPGNPGYRVGTYGGYPGQSYTEYQVRPCEGTAPCSGSYTGTGLVDIAATADGKLWFTNQLNRKVGYFDPATQTFTQYTLASIDPSFASVGDVRQIVAAPDGSLWFTVSKYPGPNALVQLVPGQNGAGPTASVVALPSGVQPLAIGVGGSDIWFTTSDNRIGRLAGVIGGVVNPPSGGGGGGAVPGGGTTTTPTTPAATPPPVAGTPPRTLAPASVGQGRVDPPQTGNGAINTNQICVGPPQDKCSVVYLIQTHEYVTGFPGTTASAAKAKKKKKLVQVLANKTVTLSGGQSKKITITLNKLGQRILKKNGRVKVDFLATEKLANGKTKVIAKKTLTVKAAKKKGKAKKAVASAAAVKRGYYIEVKTQTYIQTNAKATSIKSFQASCIVNGAQNGGNVITKGMKISKTGSFSFSGKSTLRGSSNAVIDIKITGKIANGKAKGTISYPGGNTGCADRSYSAKYYGVNPQG